MILIDTNVFLEFLLGQRRADECGKLLNKLSKGEVEGAVSRFSLHSVESIYDHGLLAGFLGNIDRSLGLYVFDTSTVDEQQVAVIAARIDRDFDDAMQYYVATKLKVKAIASYDKHLDGLDIPRVEPSELT